ncbi:hypothetical protein LINPERHAP2_LOCUS20495 [Linum perenne]
MNIGVCKITRAEIRGILEGMRLAWERVVRRLAIQTDSACAVQNSDKSVQLRSLTCRTYEVIHKDDRHRLGSFSVPHLQREQFSCRLSGGQRP